MNISKYPTIPVPPEAHRDLVRDAYAAGGDIAEAMARIVGEAIGLWREAQQRIADWKSDPERQREHVQSREFVETLAGRPVTDAELLTWRAGGRVRVEPPVLADGTAPGTSRVTPDDGAWLVAGPVLCRVTGLEPRECACSGCSAARRRK